MLWPTACLSMSSCLQLRPFRIACGISILSLICYRLREDTRIHLEARGCLLELLSLTIGQKLATWPLICGTVSDRLCTAICPGFGGRMRTYTSLSVSFNYTRL